MSRPPPPVLHRPSPSLPAGRLALAVALSAAVAVAAGLLAPAPAGAGEGASGGAPATRPVAPWTPETLDLAASLPLQEGGRVKPLDTFANYTLLRLNHHRSCKDLEGRSLAPLEWLLDVVFHPEAAARYECFQVDTSEVLDAVQLGHEGKKKRDRYSYQDLAPARARLSELAGKYMRTESKDRSAVEEGIVDLSQDLDVLESLMRFGDFARASIDVGGSPALAKVFDGRETVTLLDVLEKADEVRAISGAPADPHGGGAPGQGAPGTAALRDRVIGLAESTTALAIVPPHGARAEQPEWLTPGHVIYAAFQGLPVSQDQATLLSRLAAMVRAADDPAQFEREIRAFHDGAVSTARTRGEYDKIPTEVFLSRLDPFYRSVYLYVFAFLLLAVTWLKPSRWLKAGAWALLLGATGLHVTGIVIRCVLRERPPISTLYETSIFISALAAIACLVAERINRRGIALAVAPVVGGLGLFVAVKFEALKGEDTMPQLQAVLDTNFWLATHVTCITIGYAGGLLASVLAHVHVLGRAVGLKRAQPDFYRSLARMTYGMLAFGLVFSVVGTILGGIWANESWGRFWGWDPKENGALMICLAQLAIIHGRLGGLLKPFGVAMATIAQGCVVAFSWWGVNLLGIGLHAYGFTAGIWHGLLTFYGVEALVLAAGATTYALHRAYGVPGAPASAPEPKPA